MKIFTLLILDNQNDKISNKFYENFKMTQSLRVVARVVALPDKVEALKAILIFSLRDN